MSIPAKPCEGRLSDEMQVVLSRNVDRAQWANHKCEVCGALVGVVLVQGKWVPEQHWPSVKYSARNGADKKAPAAKSVTLDDSVVLTGPSNS